MPSKKHYVITALTLGAIAAASGLLIGATNLITKGPINDNEDKQINAGIAAVFGENSKATIYQDVDENTGYIDKVYSVQNGESVNLGWAVFTSGRNDFGKISMIVGFNELKAFKGIYLTTNEQSYASTLVEEYVDPLNNGKVEVDDVSCGATFGATLVRNMVNFAQEYVNGIE